MSQRGLGDLPGLETHVGVRGPTEPFGIPSLEKRPLPCEVGRTRVRALTSLVLDRVIHGAPAVCQAL